MTLELSFAGEKLSKTVRQQVIEYLIQRDGSRCYLCDKPLIYECITIDHFIPKSSFEDLTEAWKVSNLRIACFPCNNRKSNAMPNPDGTVVFPTRRTRVPRAKRPVICESCNSGRLLGEGESCDFCGSGPQPSSFPRYKQKKPSNCDHDKYHCWLCVTEMSRRVS